MNIDQLIDDVIEREGGYVNHPADLGGPTKYGITLATLAAWYRRAVLPHEVRELDRDTAADIFYQLFYIRPNIDRLPEALRPVMFDMGVHLGPPRAVRMLQRKLAKFTPVKVDGLIGPKTVAAIDAAMSGMMVNAMVDARGDYYRNLADRRPAQRVFLAGWLARAESFRV